MAAGIALQTARAATGSSMRTDPADVDAGPETTDLREVRWELADGTATVRVGFRDSGGTDQRVWVWADTNADGHADLLVRFHRDSDTGGTAAGGPAPPGEGNCQPLEPAPGDPQAVEATTSDGIVRMSHTVPFDPPEGRFLWAAVGVSAVKPETRYDHMPDAADPDPGTAEASCNGGDGIEAALREGFHFPDQPPAVEIVTDQAQPREGRPFRVLATGADPDGEIVRWEWELGGGEEFDEASGPEATLTRPTGDHPVALRVTDDDGLETIVRTTIRVETLDPVLPITALAIFGERPLLIPGRPDPPETLDPADAPPKLAVTARPRRPRAGRAVRLDASRSTDDSGPPHGFRWDLDGDREFDDALGSRVSYVFATPGVHRIAVEAADDQVRVQRRLTLTVRRGKRLPPVAALVRRARRGRTPTAGFERSLGGWRRIGKAFPPRPVRSTTVSAARDLETASHVGGDYADVPLPVGAVGRGWVTTFDQRKRVSGLPPDSAGDLPTGVLLSPRFRIRQRYIGYRIGGDDDAEPGARSTQRVEVWVTPRGGGRPRRVASTAAGEAERMRSVSHDVGRFRGRQGVIAVVDASPQGHVNVDAVRTFARREPPEPPPPVAGWADLHAHPMIHQAFGGLRGIKTYMGVPGGASYDYRDIYGARRYLEDTRDDPTHFGGNVAKLLMPLAHAVFPDMVEPLHQQSHITEIQRAHAGGLRLMSSLAVSNEGLEHMVGYVTGTDGGGPHGDLISGPFEEPPGVSRNKVDTTPGRQIIEAHVLGMRQLAALNRNWMEIVYSPEQAYEAIRNDKLAIVLGSEVDDLGNLGFATPEEEVDYLWRLGIRQLNPVHAVDNNIGGPPAFQDLYNTTNDLLNRPVRHARKARIEEELRDRRTPTTFGRFFSIGGSSACASSNPFRPFWGECVDWDFKPTQQSFTFDLSPALPLLSDVVSGIAGRRVELTNMYPTMVGTGTEEEPYYLPRVDTGDVNRRGLTDYGRRYVRALMRRGMLIDIEHMSDATVNDLLRPSPVRERGPVWDALSQSEEACQFRFVPPPAPADRDACFDRAYPVLSSHTTFRGLSLAREDGTGRPRSLVKDFWAREFERTPAQIEYIRRSGGIIAPVVAPEPIVRPATLNEPLQRPRPELSTRTDGRVFTPADLPRLNDCAGSSKGWLQNYLYGVQKMRGRGVALSTDMPIVGSTKPRFDKPGVDPRFPGSCPSAYANMNLDSLDLGELVRSFFGLTSRNVVDTALDQISQGRRAEEALYPQYNRNQERRLEYTDNQVRGNRMFVHRTPAGRVFDFNTEGVKTYGSLPDLIQDARNLGLARQDLAPLMSSAQAYVDMWNRAYVVSGCFAEEEARCAGGRPQDLPPSVCRRTCPLDPGRGHVGPFSRRASGG